jgi:hypothetical protein
MRSHADHRSGARPIRGSRLEAPSSLRRLEAGFNAAGWSSILTFAANVKIKMDDPPAAVEKLLQPTLG